MKLKLFLKNRQNEFILIAISIIITFIPSLIFIKEISIDKISFINEWISLFGGGTIIALIFYYMTQIITYSQNKREDDMNYNTIISIFKRTLKYCETKKGEKKDLLFEYKMIPLYLNNINNKNLRIFIEQQINEHYFDIELTIKNLQLTTLTQTIEIRIKKIINELKTWKKDM